MDTEYSRKLYALAVNLDGIAERTIQQLLRVSRFLDLLETYHSLENSALDFPPLRSRGGLRGGSVHYFHAALHRRRRHDNSRLRGNDGRRFKFQKK